MVTLGGDLVRLVSNVAVRRPRRRSADLFGVYFADETQHQEHRLWVDHAVPELPQQRRSTRARCRARTRTRSGSATSASGRPPTGTDTYELNRNLVLTDGARADSVPNLEIETGEIVGAGHASATGRFDDEQLFYLCSRGIDAETGRGGWSSAASSPTSSHRIGLPELQDRLMAAIEARLGALPGLDEQPVEVAVTWPSSGSARWPTCPSTAPCASSWPTSTSPSSAFEGEVYAIEDICSHAEVAAVRGRRRGVHGAPTIECWLHGSCFDLRTGEPTDLPATEPVSVYPVRVEGEDVLVDTDADGALPLAAGS